MDKLKKLGEKLAENKKTVAYIAIGGTVLLATTFVVYCGLTGKDVAEQVTDAIDQVTE